MSEADIRAHLERLAGTEAPPARVDIGMAVRRGRRRLRWRRAGISGTPVAAVAVIALLAGGIIPAGSGHPHTAALAGQPASPASFNPLIPYAAFGVLPAGESLIAGTDGRADNYLAAGRGQYAKWALDVLARGRCNLTSKQVRRRLRRGRQPELNCRMGAGSGLAVPVTGRGPSVDGHLAFFASGYYAWEYAPGGWAFLAGPGEHSQTKRLLRVADGVRFAVANRPSLEFPVQLTGLPSALQVQSVHYAPDAGVLRAHQYSLSGAGVSAPSFTTGLAGRGGSCYFYRGQSRHRTINGHKVTVTHLKARPGVPAEVQVCAAHADGLFEFISTFGTGHGFPSAVAIFARHLKLLGTSPANWTTRPLG
jgi:hypothetical protein